jgi:dsRNA-specific ribonuclease
MDQASPVNLFVNMDVNTMIMDPPRSAVGSSSINQTKSAKSRLQEAVAKMKRPANAVDLAIEYVPTKEEGPPHDRVFEVTCSFSFGDVSICTVGTGKRKKDAEEDAATKALANPSLRARSIGNFH